MIMEEERTKRAGTPTECARPTIATVVPGRVILGNLGNAHRIYPERKGYQGDLLIPSSALMQ